MAEETAKEKAWLIKAHVSSEEKWLGWGRDKEYLEIHIETVCGGCVLEGLSCKAERVVARMAGIGATLHRLQFLLGREGTRWKRCGRRLSWWGSEK